MRQLDMNTANNRINVKMWTVRRAKHIRSAFLLLLIIMFIITFSGCGSIPSAKPYLSDDRNTRWVNDIAYIEETLPKVHKNLYFHLSEQEFQKELEDLKNKVPEYTDEQMKIAISVILASIGDTHTGATISSESEYPIKLHWFAEGIYIIDTNEENRELLNSKIITINGKKIEDAAETLVPLLAGANESWFQTQVGYYLTVPDVLKYFGLSTSDEIELDVELQNGQKQSVKLDPVNSEDYASANQSVEIVPLYKSHPDEYYWYEYLEDKKTVYLNYHNCQQMRNKPFEIFNKEFWSFIQSHEVDKLVVDIRENSGGNSDILNSFINKLKNSSLNQQGKIYVIIGKKTYSSAILNAVSLKNDTKAYFVGEATGGEPNHYGDVKELVLPNSQISIRYSTQYFHWFNGDVDTLKPDKEIPETFDAYWTGTDPVLEWIIAQN